MIKWFRGAAYDATGKLISRLKSSDIYDQSVFDGIMKAIVETGFKGYVAQEFIPDRKTNEERLASLEKAVKICDV